MITFPLYKFTCLINEKGQPVVENLDGLGPPYEMTVEVVDCIEYERRFLPLAHAQAPIKRLKGYDASWSLLHVDHPEMEWDAAIVPYLQRLHAAGFPTVSSCQGGWFPWGDDFIPRDARRGIEVDGVLWFRKRPHLFLDAGKGHGRAGVAEGVRGCQKQGLDTLRAEELVHRFKPLRPRIAADELTLNVILEGPAMSDEQARAWWEQVASLAQA